MEKTPEEEKINQIRTLITYICNIGRLYLRENVQKLGEHPVVKYEDKNLHISTEIESISEELGRKNLLNVLETYWLNITDETDEINKTRINKLNRGVSLANTGVFQIAQTNVDEGIFNLYRALADDEAILQTLGLDHDPEINLVNISLFSQFEHPIIELVFSSVLSPNLLSGETTPTLEELKVFFSKLKPSIRLFLFGKLQQLFSSLRRNEVLKNMMSRQAILDSLSAFCLWTEDSLRRKTPSINGLYDGLKFLHIPSRPGGYHSNTLDELIENITIVEKRPNINSKRALVTLLIRNYVGHNLETNDHRFFENKEKILSYVADIFFTMLLLDTQGKI